ncbi:PLCL2-like protein, partial [Mya arenaria]
THRSSISFSVPLFSIKEVRSGKTTDALKNKEIAGIYPDECAFSIVFGDNFDSMDLIANTPDEANIWVTGLTSPEAIEEMQQMRDEYASNADYLSTDDLLLFLEAEQGMQRVTKEKCLEVINKFEPSKEGKRKGRLGIDGFTYYLLSDECDIFDPDHHIVCQDMTHPLCHYFIASSHNTYPVILSIENHCSVKQQKVMVAHMIAIFGDKLNTERIDESRTALPNEDEGGESERRKNSKKEGAKKRHKLARELSDLVNYFVSTRFEDFQVSVQKQHFWEMCSFSESQALKLAISCPEEFVNHNKTFVSRIYPNGMRVDSSNYNPQDLWNCGCQMVALNYQTPGLMIDLYNGWFHKNGNCGFVLKPAIMREEIAYFSANTKDVIPGVSPQILHIKIISGQYFPKPKGSGARGDVTDPYITIEIFGIPADCAEERTKTVPHNGYNPVFDESFEFQINLPELALVRFSVLDDDYIGDEFIGQYTIPFECMQTGYRHIRLLSNTGEPIENCCLFIHVAITNKRGGGKAHKRGMSVKKTKRKRDYASMKAVGVKSIDETFKIAIQPLRDGTDLRDNVQTALADFKEMCGLSPIANLKQCIRLLNTRVSSSSEQGVLNLYMQGEYPVLDAEGNLPDILKKALMSFDNLVADCKSLIDSADGVYERAIENFAWNIRVLQGQADLLAQAKKECQEYLRQ